MCSHEHSSAGCCVSQPVRQLALLWSSLHVEWLVGRPSGAGPPLVPVVPLGRQAALDFDRNVHTDVHTDVQYT